MNKFYRAKHTLKMDLKKVRILKHEFQKLSFLGGKSDRFLEKSSIFFEISFSRLRARPISGEVIHSWYAAWIYFPENGPVNDPKI